MPRLNPITGLAACGTAGGRVSYGSRSGEQFVLCDGGCTFWLNPDEIAYLGPLSGSWQGTPGGTAPQAVNIHTGARRPLEAVPAGAPLREASFLAAAGGRWQAAQAGAGATFGSCGEFPGGTISRAMTDGRGAAAADGSIALLDVYQGGGNGFRISRPSGELYPPASSPGIGAGEPDTYHLTLVDANRAIWPGPGAWRTIGIAPPLWIPGSLRACYLEIAGVAYVVHWLDGRGLVARRADASRGKILATADREFHYDAIAWNGGIRVAWATMDGEPPGSLEIVEWDLVSGLEELAPPPAPTPIPTFTFTHPISVYPFKAAGSGRPDLFTLGTYTEAPAPPSPLPKGRLLLAHDGESDWTIPAGALRSYDLVLWELYRVEGEPLAATFARWERQSRSYLSQWPRDCGVIPMFYCQGGAPPNELWSVGEVLEALERLDEIANLSPWIKIVAPFAYDRANGIVAHPELRQAFDNLVAAAAAAGAATLTPIPTDPPPVDPPKPVPPFRALVALKGVTMRGFVKIVTDAPHYTGVNPTAGPGAGDARFPVYYARPGEPDAGGPWETVEITKHGNAYLVRYVEADRQLSIQPNGALETRAAGVDGPFEIFQIRTEEGSGRNILYRDDLRGVVLEVELLK